VMTGVMTGAAKGGVKRGTAGITTRAVAARHLPSNHLP
jgi:hypothetical protein